MLFDFDKVDKRAIALTLENGSEIFGVFAEDRLYTDSLPKGKQWYQLRSSDSDDMEIASVRNGCVVVNFYGTLVCDPIPDLDKGEEANVTDWKFID